MTDADTSADLLSSEWSQPSAVRLFGAYAFFLAKLAAATAIGAKLEKKQWFRELNSATGQIGAGGTYGSSTQIREMMPVVRAQLDFVLASAREELIEDGMCNSVNQRLPSLIGTHFDTVIPALVAVIEAGRTTGSVAAEVLKELGRVRNEASRPLRRFALERALTSSSPTIRDGAGLGLARLSDPDTIPSLGRAIERERDPQTRADLQLVLDEISEAAENGIPPAECY